MTLKEKILKAAEFDVARACEASDACEVPSMFFGQKIENSRLTPLITAMADRIEQLEAALGFYFNGSKSEDDAYIKNNEVVAYGRRAGEALQQFIKLAWLEE